MRKKNREELVKILSVPIYPHEQADPAEAVADYLLDNDVVPVVRCKDCRFSARHDIYDPMECMKWTTKWGVAYTTPDGHCHKGERKDDE